MKKVLYIIVASITLFACEKDEEEEQIVIEANSIAEDLKQIIEDEGVQSLRDCAVGYNVAELQRTILFPGIIS